jgi:hypothetical protein
MQNRIPAANATNATRMLLRNTCVAKFCAGCDE